MAAAIAIKDAIRDFIRKYDEVTTPLIRFVMSLIMFWSLNSMYGYSDLFERGMVVFLLSVICALVSNPVAVLLGAAVIIVNGFSVSMEVGAVAVLLIIIIYCTYMRMFPKCSWILAFVPVMYLIGLECAVPIIVAIFAGSSGIVATAFGILLYYFSLYVDEVESMLSTAAKEEDVQPFTYIVEAVLKNKEMLLTMIVFAVVIMITFVVYKLPVNYSWYIAIGIGAVATIIIYPMCGSTLDVEVSMGSVVVGALLGAVLGLVAQFCKGMVDYSKKETVQFEDDEYYYYVKAIPKYADPSKKKETKSAETKIADTKEKSGNKSGNRSQEAVKSQMERSKEQQPRTARTQGDMQARRNVSTNTRTSDPRNTRR